jgi:hypothetical protein
MAIKLNAAYSKKLGLPHYSSHSFSASVEVELTDPGSIAAETARLYGVLQTSVDNEIRQVGYLPATDDPQRPFHSKSQSNGAWQCSDKQRRLLTDLCRELQLTEDDLDERSQRRFQRPARQLNKQNASSLITDLLGETEGLRAA